MHRWYRLCVRCKIMWRRCWTLRGVVWLLFVYGGSRLWYLLPYDPSYNVLEPPFCFVWLIVLGVVFLLMFAELSPVASFIRDMIMLICLVITLIPVVVPLFQNIVAFVQSLSSWLYSALVLW